MNAHNILEKRIESIEAIVRRENQRQRLNLLPPLTRAISRTLQQALLVDLRINLMRRVFRQEPVCTSEDFRSYLQKPLVHLSSAEEVFTKSQAELAEFQAQLEDSAEQLRASAERIEQQLADFKADVLREMDTVRALLKIPDLLPDTREARQVERVLNGMNKVLEQAQTNSRLSEPNALKRLANEWGQLYAIFTEIRQRLSFDTLQADYGFSDNTVAIIECLISGQAITLDNLPPQTINELQRFQQFCHQVVLQFTA